MHEKSQLFNEINYTWNLRKIVIERFFITFIDREKLLNRYSRKIITIYCKFIKHYKLEIISQTISFFLAWFIPDVVHSPLELINGYTMRNTYRCT